MAGRPSIDRFNKWAVGYDDSVLQRAYYAPLHAAVLAEAARHAPEPERLLDVGCGTGRLLRRASALFPTTVLVGIDPAERMLARASVDRAAFSVLQADAHRLPFADTVFDVVVSTASCHHWSDPSTAFAEIARVLGRGGVLVLTHLLDTAGPTESAGGVKTLLNRAGLAVVSCAVRTDCPLMPTTAVLVVRRVDAARADGSALRRHPRTVRSDYRKPVMVGAWANMRPAAPRTWLV